MDNGISDMLNGVLSNPDALNKIMTLLPAVSQIMNGGGSNNANAAEKEKIVETTAVPVEPNAGISAISAISAESLLENEEVAAAFKNLITAINAASEKEKSGESKEDAKSEETEEKPDAAAAFAPSFSPDKLAGIMNMLGSSGIAGQNPAVGGAPAGMGAGIEKTLDTLKNFSSATSPESDNRSKLLLALKPFLKDARKTKIDTAIKYMNAAKIITLFGKNGFV